MARHANATAVGISLRFLPDTSSTASGSAVSLATANTRRKTMYDYEPPKNLWASLRMAIVYLLLGLVFMLVMANKGSANEKWQEYIDWITENSDLTYNGEELPELVFMPYKVLEVEVYGPEQVAQAEYQGYELTPIRGAYFHDRNWMVVPEGADLAEDVLVHELVHFLQYLQDTPECIQELEKPAYKLHWQWVEEHDLTDKYAEPSWLFVYMIEMACRQSPYDYE